MMNLKSLLNSNEDGAAHPPPKPSPQPQQQQHPPSTPVQTGHAHAFREYSNPVHASPRSHSMPGHEYGPGQMTPAAAPYASPSMPSGPGPYSSRPVPPPMQPLNSSDLRSPSSASMSGPSGPSPFRHTPSSSISGGTNGGFPFPPTQPPSAASPVQHHQYPPSSNAYPPQRDSYPQPSVPAGMTGPPGAPPYMQGQQQQQQQQMPPHTPPIGPPAGAPSNAFPHQRSQSAHSAVTPTSAHSQLPPQQQQQQQPPQQPQQYGMGFGPGSPVVVHRQAPRVSQPPYQQLPYQQPPFDPSRHPSQPPTPLGPPLSTTQQRATSASSAYSQQQQPQQHSQPASPMQQRMSLLPQSTPSHQPYQKTPHQAYASPPPLAPSSLPLNSGGPREHRLSFTQQGGSGYNQQPSDPTHRRSLSRSDRAPSVSVSPRTRVSSLPSSAGGYVPQTGSIPDADIAYSSRPHVSIAPLAQPAAAAPPAMARPTSSSESTMYDDGTKSRRTKRKLDERDLTVGELDRKETRRPAPFDASNGNARHDSAMATTPPKMTTPTTPSAPGQPPKQKQRRPRYTEVPVWARTFDGGPLNTPNFILRKPGGSHVNGNRDAPSEASRHNSRHVSPEASRQSSMVQGFKPGAEAPDMEPAAGPAAAVAAAAAATAAAATAAAATAVSANESRIALLGPWEESVTGEKPYEELTRKVADFLYLNVVINPNMAEIQGLGVQFEIEAKLGTLISKDTNQRVSLPVASECLLQDTGRWSFKSSMTEVQHKAFNEFLNGLVVDTDARNPANAGRAKPRVPVVYKHRREIDRFFELPMGLQERLPACVRNLVPHRHAVKVRVTYDKKTGAVLAKIVKARISDLNIYFPDAPLDCRLSVNLEMTWEGDVEELEGLAASAPRERPPDREKDRLSYSQSHYQIDLTQVTYKVQGPQKLEREEKEHELEIELAPAMLIEQGRRAAGGEPHAYQELVDGLVDNVRILARRTRP